MTAALAERGLTIHRASVGRFLHREGKSFKKTVLPAEQLKPKLMRRRAQWMRYQTRIDPTRLVFLDDMGQDQHGAVARLGGRGSG
ncbi:hypothetical protein NKI48_29380 [Mesorhizobium sp. M0644]|uniref:hypothetical protein n=1 Tax=Mesorhizobium sp. M0644 TaxID=2956979 RepID=UPI003337406C